MALNAIWVLISGLLTLTMAQGPRCPPSATPDQCLEEDSAFDEYFFTINGTKLTLTYSEQYFNLKCSNNVHLENEALPMFEKASQVSFVKLTACRPPARGYAAALRALNVTVQNTLELNDTPALPSLSSAHTDGLGVGALVLSAADEPLRPEPDFLEPLKALRDLRLTGVALTTTVTLHLPDTLRALSITNAGLTSLPAEVFARLSLLTRLLVIDDSLREVDLSEAPALHDARLTAPLDGVTLGPAVTNLTMNEVLNATVLGDCSSLRRIEVRNASSPLPAGWVSACTALEAVRVSDTRLTTRGIPWNARALQVLELRRCGLRELDSAWLRAPVLHRLDLSHNDIEELPGELVRAAPVLAEVELAGNRMRRAGVAALAALPALRSLGLEHNPLHDLCGSINTIKGLSPLWKTLTLRTLLLSHTNLTHICSDWRTELTSLRTLDLSDNRIALLEYDDLQWRRDKPTIVDLRRNPVRHVLYTYQNFDEIRAGNVSEQFQSSKKTKILLDAGLQCDCREYWYARAASELPQHARAELVHARCESGAALPAARALTCALPDKLCPRACRCRADGERSELRCERAGLAALPAAPPHLPARALLLAHNNISRLSLKDITAELEEIDLSYNQITSIDAATTAALFSANRSVQLAGNPLRCDCDALPLLRALAERAPNASCDSGESAHDAATRLARCSPELWPLALVALALTAASAVVAACLTRPVARQRIKRFLFERGLCLRWLLRPLREEDDADRPYDAFVSFSHLDAQYAAELALRLERGAALRLCLHDRDWTPGEWIPTQIAESVRRSRRTVVLLSERFLQSTWARAELREAYGAALREQRPRLLLLLLPGLSPERAAAADPDLRAYLASVTYLRWDELRFWDKLLLAMPQPRAVPPPAAAA